MEEFQEADVLWPDHDHHHGITAHAEQPRDYSMTSAPVGIPKSRSSWGCSYEDGGGMMRAGGAAAAFVPPHVIAARRYCSDERVAFSVCVGHGRTLKGRDLRSVRNAVLHMTGFLESSEKD